MSRPPENVAHAGRSRWGRFVRRLGPDTALPIDPDLAPDDPAEPSPTHVAARHAGRSARRADPGVLAAIAAGGFAGTLGRYELGLAWPEHDGHFPATTFVINTSGAFLIGLVTTLIVERLRPTRYLRPFACVGVLGGWTTMSTLAVGADRLLGAGGFATGFGYLATTLVAGVVTTTLGIAVGRRMPDEVVATLRAPAELALERLAIRQPSPDGSVEGDA
ncbi:MAG TPA: CrcB family protein [Acidimicrobiales bacterium]|nr:CrcB family protein [Acidimicrobiales bacterium]